MCESDNKQSINKLPPKRTEENRNNYAKQRNLCVTLLKKSKREFHGNLNRPNPGLSEKIKLNLYFHFFVVPQKVL